MPNTLVHLCVQTPVSRIFFREADFKWIAVGCIIPDIPWIIQRIILGMSTGLNPYHVLSYVTIQASLLFCLLLGGAVSLAARSSGRVFVLLSLNCFIHLVLDSMQIKWANGVHFMAPFSWQLTSFSLFWPEDTVTYVLTLTGLAVLVVYGIRDWKKPVELSAVRSKYFASFFLALLYLLLPLSMLAGPERADNHFSSTLFQAEKRPGKYIEIDRGSFRHRDNTLRIFSGERLKTAGKMPGRDAILSVKGVFVDTETIDVAEFHVHNSIRDISSVLALITVLCIWLVAFLRKHVIVAETKTAFSRGIKRIDKSVHE